MTKEEFKNTLIFYINERIKHKERMMETARKRNDKRIYESNKSGRWGLQDIKTDIENNRIENMGVIKKGER